MSSNNSMYSKKLGEASSGEAGRLHSRATQSWDAGIK